MSSLGDRMRRQREFSYVVEHERGEFKVTLRRPSDGEFGRLTGENRRYLDLAQICAVGWEGVTEAHLLTGGGSDQIDFDKDAWSEFIFNNLKVGIEAGEAVESAMIQAQKGKVEHEKKS